MRIAPLAAFLFLLACGAPPATSPPAAAPRAATPAETPPAPSSAGSDVWKLPPRAPRPAPPARWPSVSLDAYRKVATLKGAAPAPATCAAYVSRAPVAAPPAKLADAFAETDPAKRDALLAAHEAKAGEGEGRLYARLLRADAAPVDCADALVDPILAKKTAAATEVEHALLGLALAGKLARTAHKPPQMPGVTDKAKVKAFIQGPLKTWLVDQASAIEQLSLAGRELAGYGRGVAAVEAGTAELRLVDNIRSSPTPKWDAELRQVYEVALDEALEPRKKRGRDAALVGLADLAAVGAVHDARVDRARAILSKLYGGRRIDALDQLLLPPSAEPDKPAGATYFRHADAGENQKADGARARFDAGRLYWQRADFVDAAYAAADAKAAEDHLVLALSLALARGPASAAEMMSARSPSELELGHTEALDALTTEGGPLAGMAAFDAAHLRSLSAPDGAAAGPYFADVAARFRKAESLLADPAQKKKALERAVDADAASSAGPSRRAN